jgi:hypothetical protein
MLEATDGRVGQLAQNELQGGEPSWRSEGYADDSWVHILDHDHGESKIRICNDQKLAEVLVSLVLCDRVGWQLSIQLG